jgi:hypothetical protein
MHDDGGSIHIGGQWSSFNRTGSLDLKQEIQIQIQIQMMMVTKTSMLI